MQRIKLSDLELEEDGTAPEGFRARSAGIGDKLGAKDTGTTLYELPAGQALCPYHVEYVEEEWAMVLEGRATVRTPEGIEEIEPFEVVFFPKGPDGAHQVRNDSEETVRLLMWSNRINPGVVTYPDSGKIAIWTSETHRIRVMESDQVGYWDGEARDAP
jgi:uncharacterized cupin superfamily protein